ncbi:hypothetical protein CURTO8I2_320004 [Curtobacterium sp. 8I-2]|nr:hypothetical protein CURTO8I2_320004 [Curtobacterium sp. 8I-2]
MFRQPERANRQRRRELVRSSARREWPPRITRVALGRVRDLKGGPAWLFDAEAHNASGANDQLLEGRGANRAVHRLTRPIRGLLGDLPLAIEQDPAFSCHSRRRRRTDRSPLLGEDHGFVHPRRPCTVRAGSGFRSDLVQLRLVTSSFRSLDADIGKRRAGWVIDADLVGHRPGIARLLLHERAPRGGKNDRTGEQAHCGETNGTTSACLHGFSVEDEGADVVNLTAPLSEPIEGCGIHLKADIRDWIVPVFYVVWAQFFPASSRSLSASRSASPHSCHGSHASTGRTANFGSAAPSSRSARLSTLSHC